ncbi:MAG: beta strand repeat-containing protein, partial [Acidimicrobiales bacterium]
MSFQSRARALTVLVGLGVVGLIGAGLATMLLLLGTAGSAGANPTCTDTYTGSGSWTTAANWSTGLPGPTTYACIAASAGTVTYSSTSATTIETLVSIGSGSTLSVTNGALVFQDTVATPAMNAVTVAGGDLYVEDAASITTLSVTSGSLDGIGAITAGSLSWTGGSIGNENGGTEIGSITTTGTATIDLSTLSGTSLLNYYSLVFDGPTAIEAPATDPGFQQSYSSLVFADTSSAPTIAEGEDISNYYAAHDEVEPGVTLDVTGSTGATTTFTPTFSNYGTVDIPAAATLSLSGGGTSTGTFSLTGNGVLAVNDVTFDGAGTAVTGSSGTLAVNGSSIVSNISVGTITENGTGTSYFYGTVSATTIDTGASSGASPQEGLVFDGPTITASTLDVYGASVSGTGPISAATFNWDGGSIGSNNASADPGNLTVTGTATIDLSTASGTSIAQYFAITFEGPTAIDAPVTDPGFQMSGSSIAFADTSSAPTIAEGVNISVYYPANMLVAPGVTLDVTGSGGTTALQPAFLNDGTVDVPAGASLDLNGGGTSTGTFSLTGNGILGANDVDFDGSGTAVTGSSGTLQVNGSSISPNVSVGTITEYGSSASYFYGTINATTISTGSNTGAAPQASIGFFGPTVTTQTLDIYGGNISGVADISAVTFNWDGGAIGSLNGGVELGTLTTTGTATIDLSTASGTSVAQDFNLVLEGPTSVEAPATDPGFQLSQASMTFGDTTSSPTIAEGVTITYYYPGQVYVLPGVTLDVTGSSGATTTIEPSFYNNGAVGVPAGGVLSLAGGGTSGGTFALSGNGILAVNGVSFTNSGTAVSGSSGTFDVNGSSISSNVSVGTISDNGTSPSYFYGTVNATTISTGASSGASPQASIGFFGPTVTTQTLDVYGGNISGVADISAVTFNWDGGDLGSLNGGIQIGTLTVTGTATIDLSTASNTWYAADFNLNLNGPTTIEAPATDPGFELTQASLTFGDTTSSPTIPEGEAISSYYPGTVIVSPGVTLDLSGSSGAQTTISADFDNNGTVGVPAGSTLYLYGGGTSAGTFSLTGNGILAVNGVTFTGSRAGVTGSSGSFEVNSSSIVSNVSVGTITESGSGTSYFYGTVNATTISTGASSGATPQANLVFDGPTVTTQTLDVYGGSISGTAGISVVTFNWDGGNIGSNNGSGGYGSLTTTGTATIDLSTASSTFYAAYFNLALDGPTTITAPPTDPGFQLSQASLTFGDTSSPPTIPEGESISAYYPSTMVVAPGVTLDMSGSSGATTTIGPAFDNNGTVSVPAGATLLVSNGGTSSGTFSLVGNGILAVNQVTFVGSGSGVTGSSGTFEVNNSSIVSNVSVGTITDNGSSQTDFYGTVSATTIETGASSGASPQENLVFDGPTATAQTLGIYGASVSGTAAISAVTFNWSAGNIGTYNPSGTTGSLTTTGTATIDLSTASSTSAAQYFTLNFDGPTAIEAPATDPGFQLSASAIVFGDTTSVPTIASGVVISAYYSPARVEIASGVTLDSPSSGTVTIGPELVNHGTLLLAAGATLNVTQD